MGLIDKIKSDTKKSGQNKRKFMYFREGVKQRVRFLTDMDEGLEVVFHDSFERGICVPCQEALGRSCAYCDDEDLRTRSQYAWSVWNYESNEVQILMFPVNNCSPVPALLAMHENYGTLLDRDYVISCAGKAQNKTFQVVPMDKVKFRNTKAKPFSNKAILKLIDKAWPCEDSDDDDDDEDEVRPAKKSGKVKKNSNHSVEIDVDEDDDWDEETTSELDYESMSPKELFKLCKEREIEAIPKKSAKYYINLLEEYDAAQEDWGDDDDEDEDDWEDE